MVKVIADIDLPKGLLNYSLRRKENLSVKEENCMQDESLALINFSCVLVDTGRSFGLISYNWRPYIRYLTVCIPKKLPKVRWLSGS